MMNTSQVWQQRFENNIYFGYNARGQPYDLIKWNEASDGGSMSITLADYTKFYTAVIQGKGLSKASFNEMMDPQIRIRPKQQFGPDDLIDSNENDHIELSYGLGIGLLITLYGKAFFKEGHEDGWGHYFICFINKGIAIIMMTNNDNGESIFKELLATAIGDIFTLWQWRNYIPYNQNK